MKFSIEIYQRENGDIPFLDFVYSLSEKLQAKVLRDIDLLEEFGTALREPNTLSLGKDLFELRTKQGSDIVRSIFFFYDCQKIVITNGFVKKRNKTPKRELEKAELYRTDWINRSKDGVQGTKDSSAEKQKNKG